MRPQDLYDRLAAGYEYDPMYGELCNERDQLKAENAKLRELLTFYLGCLTKGHVNCDSCAFKDDACGYGRKVIDGARELGIEASERVIPQSRQASAAWNRRVSNCPKCGAEVIGE